MNIRTLRRTGYWMGVILAGLTAFGVIAEEPVQIEEVVVTGSRIARDSNLSSNLPVQSVSSEDIRLSGNFSLAETVNDVPALMNSVTGEQSIDAAAQFSLGANILSLRGLGTARTLTLVDGRRHVGGLKGSSAVDIGSFPEALVERVEVLTGGASAVYGADAVTGVVNFIMKDDFEGFEIDAKGGLSQEGDGHRYSVSAVWGTNFADDRGNVAVAVDYLDDRGLQVSDRPGAEFIGSARDWVNPALRFQQGDIGSNTPNFAEYYNFFNTGLTNFGLPIPSQEDFIAEYNAAFGTDPTLTQTELDLISRAETAPQRAVLPGRTFPFTSGYGYIIPGNPFTFAGFDPAVDIDLDGNGNPDCLDSFTGYNSVFGAASFGVVGGCWNVSQDGSYAPVTDGLVAGDFQGFGGDSFNTLRNERSDVVLPEEKYSINVLGHYDLTDNVRAFGEAKYVRQETDTDFRPSSFWDLLFGAADNPFLPAFIQPVADAVGGVAITADPIGFDSVLSTERTTMRIVGGLEGEFRNGWGWEVSLNYGLYEEDTQFTGAVINDRFFAAIDAVTGPNGEPACRADVDPTAPPQNTPFVIPAYEEGYFSYSPGSGDCVPLNIWNGQAGFTEEAVSWVTTTQMDNLEIDQFVFSALLSGDSAGYFEMPAGPVSFVVGAEHREETSEARFDDWQRGIIPPGSPFPAGTNIADVSENTSLTFRPQIAIRNEVGEYDVTDLFFEFSVPLLSNVPAAYELTVDAAARFSDYSTIGQTTTWKGNVLYSPIQELAIRASYSKAVRAPNITELFGPLTGTTFRPADPCDAAQIQAVRADDPTLADNTQANCVAYFSDFGLDPFDAGGNYVFADPLSASFGGVVGGNPNLTEEEADTYTVGFVLTPDRWLPGFNLTVDYYDIEIDNAISAVTGQDIADGCYQAGSLNENFCVLLSRNEDPNSTQFGGFDFIQSTDINFAKLETSGFDIAAGYAFDAGRYNVELRAQASNVDKLDFFTNPSDLTEVNPELGEINRPEWAGNLGVTVRWSDWRLGLTSRYLGDQLVEFVEIETARTLYGDAVFEDEVWIHDINARYDLNDAFTLYGGVNNIEDIEPFATTRAWPTSPRGRYFFFGATWSM